MHPCNQIPHPYNPTICMYTHAHKLHKTCPFSFERQLDLCHDFPPQQAFSCIYRYVYRIKLRRWHVPNHLSKVKPLHSNCEALQMMSLLTCMLCSLGNCSRFVVNLCIKSRQTCLRWILFLFVPTSRRTCSIKSKSSMQPFPSQFLSLHEYLIQYQS